jgi:hypothetical protein
MTEPLPPLPPLPEPFAPAPRPLRSPGCGRGALIGCGVLIALFGVAAVGLSMRFDRVLVWMYKQIETSIAARLPADITPAERDRFKAAFEDLYASIGAGKLDPVSLQDLQGELLGIVGGVDSGLTREQVQRLTEAVEKAAGKGEKPGGAPGALPTLPLAPTATPSGAGALPPPPAETSPASSAAAPLPVA